MVSLSLLNDQNPFHGRFFVPYSTTRDNLNNLNKQLTEY